MANQGSGRAEDMPGTMPQYRPKLRIENADAMIGGNDERFWALWFRLWLQCEKGDDGVRDFS